MNAALQSVDSIDAVGFDRMRRLAWLNEQPERWEELKAWYRDGHIADFINDWGITFNPRYVADGLPVVLPFTLDPKQREWIEFTFQNWRDGKYAGTEKSRDVGVSWLLIAFSISLCVLFDDFVAGWGSFKQEKVDKRGDMGSLFEKGRAYADALPKPLRAGFDLKTCAPERLIRFPQTRSGIIGEVGDQIGRGGRTSIYFVDEAAYLERDQGVDAALAKNTNCRQDVSSVCGMTNSFSQRMHDGYSRKFTFHWRDNPRFTQQDYDDFLKQWGPVITAQELDINYLASVEGVIILSEWVQACVDAHKKLNVEPSGIRRGALDIADEGRDLNAFAARHGMLVIECVSWSGKNRDIAYTTERAYRLCDDLRLDGFDYDADGGYGAGVRSEANRIDERRSKERIMARRVSAFRGSGEVFDAERVVPGTDVMAKDRFQNAKAQAWHWLSWLFYNTFRAVNGEPHDPNGLISLSSGIKELAKLCIELSQPQWKIATSGKLMVDKTPDGYQSPNLADAVMMVFAPRRLPMKINPSLIRDLVDSHGPAS